MENAGRADAGRGGPCSTGGTERLEQTKRGFGAWGWFLLLFGLLIFFSNGGFFSDGTNIISPAVAERLQVEQGLILTMNSIAGVVGVLVAVAAGQLNQRIGPSKVTAGCLILAGLGHIAACNAVNVPMYLIAMCFVGGGLSAGSFVGIGTLVAMWFPKKQGQAMSVVAMGSNFGTMLFVPLLNIFAGTIGIPMGAVLCGGIAAAVGVLGMVLLRDTPIQRGLYPDNVTEAEYKANYSTKPPEISEGCWTTGQLLRTKVVWLCVFATGFLMLAQMGIMTQLVDRNIEVGIDPTLAVNVMSAPTAARRPRRTACTPLETFASSPCVRWSPPWATAPWRPPSWSGCVPPCRARRDCGLSRRTARTRSGGSPQRRTAVFLPPTCSPSSKWCLSGWPPPCSCGSAWMRPPSLPSWSAT